MKSVKSLLSSAVLKEGLKYIEKEPMKNLPKLLNWADKLASKDYHKNIINHLKNICNKEDNNWNIFIKRFFKELNPNVRNKAVTNFFLNSAILGLPIRDKKKQEYNCNVPWAILMDPTSACNLNCTGCWASEYGQHASLDNDQIDKIITEGKELGIYMYIFSGGEPLVRKDDLIKIAQKHDDCMFLAFTNATLIDENFAKELAEVGNFALAISVEGFEEETDMRRGKGTYQKVMAAMDLLKKEGILFGFSTCYHSKNTEVIGSDEYVDFLIDKGCMFGWYFTYIPIGKDASINLLATPDQREYMYHKVRKMRQEKPIFMLDFWNDGEYVNGCIAGGRIYLHINANGDVEPCAFIHYSNVNIKNVSLIEALRSPLFLQYKENQPFNKNHLRPCPLLDNPDKLKEMVEKSSAYSTQPIDKESVNDLTDKCQDISKKWADTAKELYNKDS
ncbi:radical SAM protein [Tepidibacter aestuarii]|uniref:radical SAM protein n=1 Tax=Tepidibacter aestuarii TaxID=2925782 RepID=UPI0020BEA9FE|nr:radical SAM protein [Tepidibacter aestuarii]CAH2214802.1 Fe-S oxidoreductase [Tepidibacter aestuarii]